MFIRQKRVWTKEGGGGISLITTFRRESTGRILFADAGNLYGGGSGDNNQDSWTSHRRAAAD